MRDERIGPVLTVIRKHIVQFDDEPSVGEVARKTHDPYAVLIATLLSLRNREENTRVAQWALLERAPDVRALAAMTEEQIAETIPHVVFAHAKAKTLRDVARRLVDEHDAKVPDTLEGLVDLKGVGLKTANLVLGLGYGVPAICVDIHVHRITNRWGYVATKSPDATEAALRGKLPEKYWVEINQLLVPFGRNQCTPARPVCSTCPVRAECDRVGVTTSR